MSFIAICGGGGKSYISKKYYHKFLDLDEFIYSNIEPNKKEELLIYIENKDFDKIGIIYKNVMIENKNKLNDIDKIVLGHHPINAEYLNLECIDIIKPNKNYTKKIYKNREVTMKEIARNCWNNLLNSYIYKSHLILNLEYYLIINCFSNYLYN